MTPEEALLSISAASRFLGVSEPALRQWTDERKIKAFVTPGGHRRYSRSELKNFLRSNQKLLGVKELASQLEESAPVHRQLDNSFLQTTSWYKFNIEAQAQFAVLGRKILTLIIRSIREPARKDELLMSIREIGTQFGEMTARLDMSLTDSIQAFVQHRDPLMRVATKMMKNGEGVQRRVVEAIPLVDHVMDEALVALVQAHQQTRKVSQGSKRRETMSRKRASSLK